MNSIAVRSRERADWFLKTTGSCTSRALIGVEHSLFVKNDDPQLASYGELARETGADLRLLDLPTSAGSAETMDSIIESAVEEGLEWIAILDDDLSFCLQDPFKDVKPKGKLEGEELNLMLNLGASVLCDEAPHASLPQVFNRSHSHLLDFCKPMNTVHLLYVPHYAKHPEHRFTVEGMSAYTDFRLSLRELSDGYLTCLATHAFVAQKFNAPGGCSVYRTMQQQWDGAKVLARDFPDFVVLRERRGWGDDADVVLQKPSVSWKKAFNAEAFMVLFGVEPSWFATQTLRAFDERYALALKELKR